MDRGQPQKQNGRQEQLTWWYVFEIFLYSGQTCGQGGGYLLPAVVFGFVAAAGMADVVRRLQQR